MKDAILVTLLSVPVTVRHASLTEYIITSPENVMFNLNCTGNPDEQNILQHHVMLTFPDGSGADSHDDQTVITLVINDRQFPLPSSLGWRNADNA